jgi:hypothetical protein
MDKPPMQEGKKEAIKLGAGLRLSSKVPFATPSRYWLAICGTIKE